MAGEVARTWDCRQASGSRMKVTCGTVQPLRRAAHPAAHGATNPKKVLKRSVNLKEDSLLSCIHILFYMSSAIGALCINAYKNNVDEDIKY